MENLYEDLYGDIKHMLNNKKRKLNTSNVELHRSDSDPDTMTSDSNFNNGKMNIDYEFCKRLTSYLDKEMNKSFPTHTKLKAVLNYELKKLMKSGEEKEIAKTVEKVRDIILKEKVKFLDSIEKKVSKVLISKY